MLRIAQNALFLQSDKVALQMEICALGMRQLETVMPQIIANANIWRIGVDLTFYGSQFKLALGFVYLATVVELS